MNAPYDGDRDAAGQMPPSPEQHNAPPNPYPQDGYAYPQPYPQQYPQPGPEGPGSSGGQFYDQSAHPQAPYPPQAQQYGGGQQWQQQQPPASYQQMTYGDNPASLYVDDLGQTGALPVFDSYEHLFRDQQQQQQQQGGYPAPQQDPQQQAYGYPQQYQQPYQQPQDPQQGYYQPQPGYQQPYGYPQGPEGTGYADPSYGETPYGQPTTYQGDHQYMEQGYADPQQADPQQYGQGAVAGAGYVDPRYADPRYAPAYPQPGQQGPGAGPATGTGLPPRDATGQIPVVAPPAAGGKAGNILKSSALMAAGTLVSRVTGFVRTLVIAAAIGVATLGDSYAVANVLPTMIYILTIGGGLNSVFVPQLARAMKNDEDGGSAYANRLLTVVMVVLGGIVAITVAGAPLLVKLMSPKIAQNPDSYDVAISFARYCLPTIFFMGVHVVMGQVLNARGRFGAMMWTPVLNNIVVIFTFLMFIWVYGPFSSTRMDASTITPEGTRLLGIGTLLGLVVQSLSMLPYLRDAGFKFRPRFDWRGHGLGHTAKLAKWTFFFVLANQAGLIVVTQLATWAGADADKAGYQGTGITAYNNALLIWQMPQAIITVSVMAAVLPRISRAAADGDITSVRDDISYGLRTSAVAIVPAGFAFLALGVPMCGLLYASTGAESARNIGFIVMAFGVGLIPFSAQYVILRGFYAFEDTRTPFYNTVVVAAVNGIASVVSFLILPSRWAVVGMAFSYGLAYAVGVGVAAKRLRGRLQGDLDGKRVMRTYARLTGACVPAAGIAGIAVVVILKELGSGAVGSLAALVVGGGLLLGIFVVAAKRMRIEEMTAMIGMVRGRLGR
ncbi:putative peptidoglycan lipid II flippase [Actinacidiphila yanglinensis]|uniref:Putative peptidoglycan lipid II flippase n=1 Tax=Actinacidiphila yanglinensis TaxID=310779 RepID=A0A1H6A8N5_9ACTN|nr:murein biosynthesis integral membrane protein MurJ [Actinacidiphila yanglinensis]SEG44096.1 putative peptidoglycan lipid II flippase [Actinacidiphila yanglinensis]